MKAGWGNRRPPALRFDWEISTQVPPLKFQLNNGGRSPFLWKQLKNSSRGSKSYRHNNPLFDHLTVTITHITHKPCVYVPQIAFILSPPVLFQKALSWNEHKLQVTGSLRWVILMLRQSFMDIYMCSSVLQLHCNTFNEWAPAREA